jgi:hypothetical protein
MNEPGRDVPSASLTRIARLWTAALVLLLAINFSLVALAVSGIGRSANSAPLAAGQTAGDKPPTAIAHDPATVPLEIQIEVPSSEPPVGSLQIVMEALTPQTGDFVQEHNAAARPADSIPPAAGQLLVIVVNPPDTGGAVHYAVDGALFSLLPGEFQRLDAQRPRQIQFHRGDNFGYADQRIAGGMHVFGVGDTGWVLRQADGDVTDQLLSICRPLSP